VQEGSLLVLHEYDGLQHSLQVADRLYMTSDVGEVRAALDAQALHETEAYASTSHIRQGGPPPILGKATPRVKLIAGYAGWARAQLDAELQRNVWFHVDVDDAAALSFLEASPPQGSSLVGSSLGGSSLEGEGAPSPQWLRDAMWSGLLRGLGGEHEALSLFPGDHKVVWEQMREVWEKQSEELEARIELLGEGD